MSCAWEADHKNCWIRKFSGQFLNKARTLFYNIVVFQLFIWRCRKLSYIRVIFFGDVRYRIHGPSFFLIWWTTFKVYWIFLFIGSSDSKLFLEWWVCPKFLAIVVLIEKKLTFMVLFDVRCSLARSIKMDPFAVEHENFWVLDSKLLDLWLG